MNILGHRRPLFGFGFRPGLCTVSPAAETYDVIRVAEKGGVFHQQLVQMLLKKPRCFVLPRPLVFNGNPERLLVLVTSHREIDLAGVSLALDSFG